MEMKIEWVVSDLDGTLIHHTNDKNIIYDDVVSEVNRISESKKFTIATGRHYKDVLEINKRFKINMPNDSFIIGTNGCQIYSLKYKKLILNKMLNDNDVKNEIPKIISYLDKILPHSTLFFAYAENENVYFIRNKSNQFEIMAKNVVDFEENDSVFKYSIMENVGEAKNITKFCITFLNGIDDPIELVDNLKKISNKFDYANTGSNFMEIIVKNINKATALDFINTNYYKIKRDNILLFGDSGNDVEMMDYAGTSITRDDARDEIKKRANIIYPGGASKFVKNALIELIK